MTPQEKKSFWLDRLRSKGEYALLKCIRAPPDEPASIGFVGSVAPSSPAALKLVGEAEHEAVATTSSYGGVNGGARQLARLAADGERLRLSLSPDEGIPPEFLEPILGELMSDPVRIVGAAGAGAGAAGAGGGGAGGAGGAGAAAAADVAFERCALERWLRLHSTHPLTGAKLSSGSAVGSSSSGGGGARVASDAALLRRIESFKERQRRAAAAVASPARAAMQ